METVKIEVDRHKARELYRRYKTHAHYSSPIDAEIRLAYKRIAQGHTVIKALESIVQAGTDEDGLPLLAIARADATACHFQVHPDGSGRMSMHDRWPRANEAHGVTFRFPASSFPGHRNRWNYEAQMPLIPIDLRPKRGLQNYHVLWEAEWDPIPPCDPLLLRQIGKGDMWLVVAAWDLTEVERAALQARIPVQ